jgi:hypothetical protein
LRHQEPVERILVRRGQSLYSQHVIQRYWKDLDAVRLLLGQDRL